MSGLLVVGAGGHGKVVADCAFESGYWRKIAFLDDRYPELNSSLLWPVLGKVEQAPLFLQEYSNAIIAIGDNLLRAKLVHRFRNMGFSLPVILHPTAFVSRLAVIGEGSVLFAQTAVNAGAQIGLGSIVNTSATVDHDCVLGNGVHVSAGVHLGGTVKVGHYSCLGIGSTVIHQVSIGDNVIIGAGAVIICNVPNDVTVVGVPGRIIKKHGILGGP